MKPSQPEPDKETACPQEEELRLFNEFGELETEDETHEAFQLVGATKKRRKLDDNAWVTKNPASRLLGKGKASGSSDSGDTVSVHDNSSCPLIVVQALSGGIFGNPDKLLADLNQTIFAKRLVGGFTVKGRSSSLHFRVSSLDGLDLHKVKQIGDVEVKAWVANAGSLDATASGNFSLGVISPISLEVSEERVFEQLNKFNEGVIVSVDRLKDSKGELSLSLKVKFVGSLPKSVKWAFQNFSIRQFFPQPRLRIAYNIHCVQGNFW